MIDAQRPAVPAILADGFDEQPVTVLAVPQRVGRRKGPVLPPGRKIVGRRSHPAARHIEGPVRPQVAAEAVGGQGQVVIQADRKAPARPLLRAAQLQIDLPLQGTTKVGYGILDPCLHPR